MTRRANIAIILAFLSSTACLSQEMPRIVFSEKNGEISVDQCDIYRLHLLSKRELTLDQWHDLLAIYVTDKNTGKPLHNLPILGQYKIEDDQIHFKPRFPFKKGINYLARFNIPYFYALLEENTPLPDWQKIIDLYFRTKSAPILPRTQVDRVYPDLDTLPVNQLKLYIYFSQAMQEGRAYDHLQILDREGKPVDQPFLELSPELWDSENTRLTVWFDPGRIKRGLSPNALKGLPLKEGNKYTLRIGKEWKDKTGRPLQKSFEKEYYITEADRQAPIVSNWTLQIPTNATKDKLILEFDEPMDHALMGRMIRISTENKEIAGKVGIANQAKTWLFEPDEVWRKTSYEISINTKIEDLAGNSLRRLFDTPIDDDIEQTPAKERELIIPIKIGAKVKNKKVRKHYYRTSTKPK